MFLLVATNLTGLRLFFNEKLIYRRIMCFVQVFSKKIYKTSLGFPCFKNKAFLAILAVHPQITPMEAICFR